jgi:hypothetical protein
MFFGHIDLIIFIWEQATPKSDRDRLLFDHLAGAVHHVSCCERAEFAAPLVCV